MRRTFCVAPLVVAFLLVAAASASAGGYRGGGYRGGHYGGGYHGGGYYGGGYHRGGHYGGGTRVVIGVGAPFWWGPRWWGAPYGYPGRAWYAGPVWPPPGPYCAGPPTAVVVQPPPIYVERPLPTPDAWWYYCPSAGDYYPNVPTCPQPWVRVAPRGD